MCCHIVEADDVQFSTLGDMQFYAINGFDDTMLRVGMERHPERKAR